jgi:hypothetical protein
VSESLLDAKFTCVGVRHHRLLFHASSAVVPLKISLPFHATSVRDVALVGLVLAVVGVSAVFRAL